MIAAYHGKADGSAVRVLAVNPFAPIAQTAARGFGGMTARLGPAHKTPPCLSRQMSIRFDNGVITSR